jgi:hypothetical protein
MTALVAVLLAMATTLFGFAITIARGDLLKSAPAWLVPLLITASGILYILAVILAIIHWKREKRENEKPPPLPPQPAIGNITQNVEANPKQEQHFHIGDEFLRQIRKTVEIPEPPPPLKSTPVVTPLLEVIADKPILIAYNGREWYEEDPSNPHLISNKLNAHIIVFRKQPAIPGESSAPLLRVTAHLTYRGKGGSQLLVDFGAWLREYTHYVDFIRAETHALILATGVRAGGKVDANIYALDNPHQTDPRRTRFRSDLTISAPTEKPIMDDCCELELVLVAGHVTVYHGSFDCALNPEGTMRHFYPC